MKLLAVASVLRKQRSEFAYNVFFIILLPIMTYFTYGIYADSDSTTLCYAATVNAQNERDALALLKPELKLIPVPLYIGPLEGKQAMGVIALLSDLQKTTDKHVVLVRVSLDHLF